MALTTFYELEGIQLEEWFKQLFSEELKFPYYYKSIGQIPLDRLKAGIEKGHHLEIDALLKVHKTCILFEFTAQGGSFREKIKKFLRNAQLFINDKNLSMSKKFELFGIPSALSDDFEDVEYWKFVYFGTHPDFDQRKYGKADFMEFSNLSDHLYIFQPSDLEYLRQLVNSIGSYGRNELLALLNFLPADLGDQEESFTLDYIKADNKYIAGDSEIKADVYLLKFKVKQLLEIAKVSRFEGIPYIMEQQEAGGNYQRLLIDEKLNSIAEKFICGNKKKTFPNTITIALTDDCEETITSKLRIPKKFSSLDIIDGQHRLFGYTRPEVSDQVRENAEILATAIKFKTDTPHHAVKCAAKVFCEVNSTQAKVSKDLLYLIKYDVLGDRDLDALAGKILLECDRKEGPLNGMFALNTLRRHNKHNQPCISIIPVIEQEIIPLLRGEGLYGVKLTPDEYVSIVIGAEHGVENIEFVNGIVRIFTSYFSYLKSTFPKDWAPNTKTLLISEKYILAFFRYLRFYLLNHRKSMQQIHQHLHQLKKAIEEITPQNTISFPPDHQTIPNLTASTETIFNFLVNHE